MINKKVLSLVDGYKPKVMMLYGLEIVTLLANIGLIHRVVRMIFVGVSLGSFIMVLALKMLLVLMGILARNALSRYVKEELRMTLFAKMQEGVLDKGLMSQMISEGVEQVDLYYSNYLPQFFYALSAPVVLFMVIFRMRPSVGLVLLMMVPLIPVSIIFVQKFAKKLLTKHYGQYLNMGSQFIESMEGLTTLKMYDLDAKEQIAIDQGAEGFRKTTMRVLLMQLNSISVMDLIAYGGAGIAVIMVVSAYAKGLIGLDEGIIMILLSAEYFIPMRLLGSYFHVSMNGVAAGLQMVEYLEMDSLESMESDVIHLKGLNFSYGDKEVLKDVDFKVEQGEWVGIAGVSGCGKSTLMKLLTRQINHDIAVYSDKKLIDDCVFMDYETILFKGSLRDNLLMANQDSSEGEMRSILDRLKLGDISLDCIIDPNASNLSGGQKQRIALARALLKNADVYFFDEITSAVDGESEAVMMDMIKELHRDGKTIVMISHRLSNLKASDRLYYMNQGSVGASGTFDKVLEANSEFNKLYMSQYELERSF